MMEPKRVPTIYMLAAMPYPTNQGTQVLCKHIFHALKQSGIDIRFFHYPYPANKKQLSFDIEPKAHSFTASVLRTGATLAQAAKEYIWPMRSGFAPAKLFWDAQLFGSLSKQLHNSAPVLLYAHNYEALMLGILLKQKYKIPLLYHAHNVMEHELPSYYNRPIFKAITRQLGIGLDQLPLKADHCIVFHRQHVEELIEKGYSENLISVIPPGLLMDEPIKIKRYDAGNKLTSSQRPPLDLDASLLYCGNLDAYQDLPLLFRALERVWQHFPKQKVLFLTAASQDEFYRQIRKTPGAMGRCYYWRQRSYQQLELALQHCVASLIPRTAWWGFPVKALNAMRSGSIIVGMKSSLGSLLPKEVALLSDDNCEAYADQILKLLRYPEQHDRIRSNARRVFVKRFALETQLPEYVGTFQQMF